MERQGSKEVPVVGKDDKWEIAALLSVTASGMVLPPLVTY